MEWISACILAAKKSYYREQWRIRSWPLGEGREESAGFFFSLVLLAFLPLRFLIFFTQIRGRSPPGPSLISATGEAVLGILQVRVVGSLMTLLCDRTKTGRLWEQDGRWASRELRLNSCQTIWSNLPVVAVHVVFSLGGETLKKIVYMLSITQWCLI